MHARRICPEKFSNGDPNRIQIFVRNHYPFETVLELIDELPEQFQVRNHCFHLKVNSGEEEILSFDLRPFKRGEYHFGHLNLYSSTSIGFISRRYRFDNHQMVPTYPSFIQMRKYELMAFTDRLQEVGVKRIRRIGHTMEFEQIREYVQGDDMRKINWKASARRNELMVNQYQDEKGQPVYSLIDKGRAMRMPFNKLSLLDYAINASLVISNIALKKEDKAGLLTFSNKIADIVPAERRSGQMFRIMESLYNQKTAWQEPDYQLLSAYVNAKLRHRSLLLLFTNFESSSSLRRHMAYFSKMARNHLLVLILFENTELSSLIHLKASSYEEVYRQTIAEKLGYEKQLMIKELNQHGIHVIFTAPENLTVNTINKYLELKSRGLF